MANRSYLYSLSNRPTSYTDRPETISGLSEWAWAIPFSFRVLMSGDPQLCVSLVADGFLGDPPNRRSKVYAISSEFDSGFARLNEFFSIVRPIAEPRSPYLTTCLDETVTFLESHRDRFLLLETIELDCISHSGEKELRAAVEGELFNCRRVGAAIDALTANLTDASQRLELATQRKLQAPLDAFYGLRLDDQFDNTRDEKTEYPLGLWWDEVLFLAPRNRAEFEASQ